MLRRSLVIDFVVVMLAGCLLLGGQSQRPLLAPPQWWAPRCSVLRRLVSERRRHDHLLVRIFQPQSGSHRDSARPNNFIEPKQYDGRQPTSFSRPRPVPTKAEPADPIVPGGSEAVLRSPCPQAFRTVSFGHCSSEDRLTRCREPRRAEPISFDGPWRWDRFRRLFDSRQTVRPVAVLREFRLIPFELPSGHRFLCPSGSPTTACGNRNPFLFAHAGTARDERDLVQTLGAAGAGGLRSANKTNHAVDLRVNHVRNIQAAG